MNPEDYKENLKVKKVTRAVFKIAFAVWESTNKMINLESDKETSYKKRKLLLYRTFSDMYYESFI